MLELRKDYILDRWVIIAHVRSKRPREFEETKKVLKPKICAFCPGNENLTPKEIGRIEKNGKWVLRWFSNKFPFVEQKGNPKINVLNKFFTSSRGYGKHEVIVDTNRHELQLEDTSKEHIKVLLDVIKHRIDALHDLKSMRYVLVFKNSGEKAGTSIIHSHTQLVAISEIPPAVREEINAVRQYKKCPYCDIIKLEGKSKRKCFENKTFLAFVPYASRFNYEIWVFPKKHIKEFGELNEEEVIELAEVIQNILLKLKKLGLSYNLYFHYSPEGENLHFHVEITPRTAVWAGFEFSSGIMINSVTPEAAAKFYKS